MIGTGPRARSYASTARKGGTASRPFNRPTDEVRVERAPDDHVIDLWLKKTAPDADTNVTMEEVSDLIFSTIGLPRDAIEAIDATGDRRKISIRTNRPIKKDLDLDAVQVKTNVITSTSKDGRNAAWVNIQGASTDTSEEMIRELLSPFGLFTSPFKRLLYEKGSDSNNFLEGIWTGERKVAMLVISEIPSFAYIGHNRVRITYQNQPRRCTNCGQTQEEGCPGGTNNATCKAQGMKQVDLWDIWYEMREEAEEKKLQWEARDQQRMRDRERRLASRTSFRDSLNSVQDNVAVVNDVFTNGSIAEVEAGTEISTGLQKEMGTVTTPEDRAALSNSDGLSSDDDDLPDMALRQEEEEKTRENEEALEKPDNEENEEHVRDESSKETSTKADGEADTQESAASSVRSALLVKDNEESTASSRLFPKTPLSLSTPSGSKKRIITPPDNTDRTKRKKRVRNEKRIEEQIKSKVLKSETVELHGLKKNITQPEVEAWLEGTLENFPNANWCIKRIEIAVGRGFQVSYAVTGLTEEQRARVYQVKKVLNDSTFRARALEEEFNALLTFDDNENDEDDPMDITLKPSSPTSSESPQHKEIPTPAFRAGSTIKPPGPESPPKNTPETIQSTLITINSPAISYSTLPSLPSSTPPSLNEVNQQLDETEKHRDHLKAIDSILHHTSFNLSEPTFERRLSEFHQISRFRDDTDYDRVQMFVKDPNTNTFTGSKGLWNNRVRRLSLPPGAAGEDWQHLSTEGPEHDDMAYVESVPLTETLKNLRAIGDSLNLQSKKSDCSDTDISLLTNL